MIKLILILTVIYIVFYLLSTNVYDELKEVTKTCLDNNPEMINICTTNTTNISSNFTRCFTSKLDTLINKNENTFGTINWVVVRDIGQFIAAKYIEVRPGSSGTIPGPQNPGK